MWTEGGTLCVPLSICCPNQPAVGYISLGGSHHLTRSRENIALSEYGITKPNPTTCEASPFLMPELRKAMCEGWEPPTGTQTAPTVAAPKETPTAPTAPIEKPVGAEPAPNQDLGEMQKALEGIAKDADRLEAALRKASPNMFAFLSGESSKAEPDNELDKLIKSNIGLLASADASFYPDLSGDDIKAIKAMYMSARRNDLMAERAKEWLTKEFDTYDKNGDGYLDMDESADLKHKFDGLVTDEQAVRNFIAENLSNISQVSVDSWWGKTIGWDSDITKQDVAGLSARALDDMTLTKQYADSRGAMGAKVGIGAGVLAQRALKFEGKMRWVGYGTALAAGVAGNYVGYQIGKHQAQDYVPQLQEFFKAYNHILNAPPPAELVQ